MFFLFLGVLGIGIRLNIDKKNLLLSTAGGVLSTTVFNLFNGFLPDPATVFVTSLAASLYSEIMARVRKTPTSIFFPSSIIPILPGKAVYDTVNLALRQDTAGFLESSISTFYTTMAIALGIITIHTAQIIFSKIVKNLFLSEKR